MPELVERTRHALAEVEEQRDDTIVYLGTLKRVLGVVARGHGFRHCGQEIAEVLLQQLAIETCAIVLRDGGELGLGGFATQSQRLGGPRVGLGEAGWLALAQLVGPGAEPSCFRRTADGGFTAVRPAELTSEGFLVLPFAIGEEIGGALVLHSLVAPAHVFARAAALALIADSVGQALTVARARETSERLAHGLEAELGVTRRALSASEESLRSHEANIEGLTQALIRSNRVKGEFLGMVSHELRTPLNAILGYAQLLRDGVPGAVNDEQLAFLDRVLRSTRHLNALVDDILFFVQVEADRVILRPDRVATAELIGEALAALPERAAAEHVGLRVEVGPEVERLHVDGQLVRRLLVHLVGNAFKFTSRGEVTIAVRGAAERGAAVVVVRDTGVGIAPDRLKEVFDLFAQGDSSNTRRYSGLGMGLTLVRTCVRLLGGDIEVESQPEAGSEFRVHLPGVLEAPAEDATDDAAAGATLRALQ